MQIHVSTATQPDLERIWDFYLAIDEKLAARAIKAVFSGLDILLKHPEVGHMTEGNLRALPIKFGRSGFIALYRYNPLTEDVMILRIRHQREQDIEI
jgi:plasmid stabilization system protein ParE